jgi:hypothetical protein
MYFEMRDAGRRVCLVASEAEAESAFREWHVSVKSLHNNTLEVLVF